MTDFHDALESRDPHGREKELLAALPALIQRAQAAAAWSTILSGVTANDINSREALAQLPVTRKSELKTLQSASLPFGGLATTATRDLSRIFMSPGPIFDPEGMVWIGGALRDRCMHWVCDVAI